MSTPYSPLASQIDQAHQQGYSDDEILDHLSKSRQDLAPKISEARQSGYASDEIVNHIKSTPVGAPPQPQQGFLGNAVDALGDVATGVGKGLASTVFHGGDLIRRGLGMDRVINRPEVQAGITPTNTAQKIGYGTEQAAEYLAPTGIEGAATKMIETAPSVARLLGRAIIKGASAGAVAGAQTGGDTKAMRNAALAAGGTSAAIEGVAAAIPGKQKLAERLYQSALKPSTALDQTERQAIIRTGLREGIKLDPNVVDTVQQRISGLNQQISDEIAQRSAAGATVDPAAVADYTKRAMNRLGTAASQATPGSDAASIQGVKNEFMAQHSLNAPYTKIRPGTEEAAGTYVPEGTGVTQVPQPIPLSEAQTIKQGTYRKLKDSYGEQSTATREALKDIARGLKDKIVEAFPEIASLNARESSLLALESSLQRFVGRTGNHNLIGLGTPLAGVAAHSVGAPAGPLMLLKAALEAPEIKSRIAIALAKSAANPGAGTAAASALRNVVPATAAYSSTPNTSQ